MKFTMSSESSELKTSFDSDDSEINFIALSKWPAARYLSQILRNGRDPSNSKYHMSINKCQAIQKSSIDRRYNAWLTLGSESDTVVYDTATGHGFQITKWSAVMQ